ncbi:MAG: hypothetical protein J6A58_10070 [Oscillospiraceae bacterium]|nr:hypothetical protein [Oscillospiraceae bacterium]
MRKENLKKTVGLVSSMVFMATVFTGCNLEEFFNEGHNNSVSGMSSSYTEHGYGKELEPDIHELKTDSEYRMLGAEETALFETKLSDEDIAMGVQAALYSSDGEKICDMYDDGTSGDKKAGDKIYSCLYNVSSESGEEQSYVVKIGEEETNPIKFTYFDDITDEEYDYANSLSVMFDEIAEKYTQDGVVTDKKSAFEEILSKADDLVEQGIAIDYDAYEEGYSLVVNLTSGIGCFYQIKEPDTDGSSDVGSIEVFTYQPCKEGYPFYLDMYMDYIDDGAEKMDEEFEHVSFKGNYDDDEVKVKSVNDFSQNQIILWHGHGGYTLDSHSIIVCSNEEISTDDEDYIKRRVYVYESGAVGFSHKYVDYYCPDLTGSVVYMGCCSSAKDTVLAASFLNKGAELFLGNDGVIRTTYNIKMIKQISKGLSEQKKDFFFFDGGYRTASEALEYANEKEGEHCSCCDTKVVMYGNIDYKLSEAEKKANEETGVATTTAATVLNSDIQLKKSFISFDIGSDREHKIDIEKLPDGYTEEDLLWTSSDNAIAYVKNGVIFPHVVGNVIVEVKTKDGKYVQYCSVSIVGDK